MATNARHASDDESVDVEQSERVSQHTDEDDHVRRGPGSDPLPEGEPEPNRFVETVEASRPGGPRDSDGHREHRTPAGVYPDRGDDRPDYLK